MSNSPPNKLKSAIKYGTELTLNLLKNLIRNSNDETNFSHIFYWLIQKFVKLLQMFRQLIKKFSKTQLSKTVQSGGFISPHDIFIAPIEGLCLLSKSIAK